MNSLRLEADEANGKVEELQTKVKTLEQDSLSKEQEITSLQHKNGVLEGDVDKLETSIKDLKKSADEGQQHGTQNETLQRRLQLLEEEAEEADKTLREANEKYVVRTCQRQHDRILTTMISGSAKPTSRLDTSNARYRPSSKNATSGSRSTRRWRRSTLPSRRSWTTSSRRLAPSKEPSARCLVLEFLSCMAWRAISASVGRSYSMDRVLIRRVWHGNGQGTASRGLCNLTSP